MSSDKTLNKLIIAVKSRPCIYDPTHCMHKNKKVINKSWNEIADELNENKQKIGKLKRRWKGLRSSYLKYRKANDSTRESTYFNQYKEYDFGPQLEFLEPHFQHINEEEDSDDSNSNITNEVPHEPVIDIPITESDDIKYLFLSYAKTLRKLSPRVKISLKFELAKLFLKAEWEQIQERDYSIPLKMETHFSDDE